jgi:ATP/ADP translocase
MNKKQLFIDFAWGPIIVCASLLASYLRDLGYTDDDTVTRVVMCLSGLIFTGLWAFAEMAVASPLGIAILVLSLAITVWHVYTIYQSASKSAAT